MKTIKSSAKTRLEIAADGNPLSSGEVLKIIAAHLRTKKWTKIPSGVQVVTAEVPFVVNRTTADKLVAKLNAAFPSAQFKLYAVKMWKPIAREAADMSGISVFCIGDYEKGGARINIEIDEGFVRVIWNEDEMPGKANER